MKNKIKNGLCICTPFYSEDVKVQYMTSLVQTHAEFQRAGIPIMNIYLYNTSLITKARNTLVSKFMQETDFEYMIFIDSDIEWKPKDLIKLMNYDKEIIGATYPKKTLDWQEIQKAIIHNKVDNPMDLIEKTSHYTIWDKKKNVLSNGLMEIERLGTGFMMIKKNVLSVGSSNDFNKALDELRFKYSALSNRIIFIFFEYVDLDKNLRRFLI